MTRGNRLAPALVLLVPIGAAAPGCGGPEPCIVAGRVLVDGEPAGGVYVVFHARGEVGSDRSGEDGTFAAVIDEPGEASVTAFRPRSRTTEDGDLVEGPDEFRGRYRDPDSPVARLSVQRGENVLPPIELRSVAGKSGPRPRR